MFILVSLNQSILFGCNFVYAADSVFPQVKGEVVSALLRIYQDTPVTEFKNQRVTIRAAGNEFESVQLAIRSEQEIRVIGVEASDLVRKGYPGAISRANFDFKFPHYVYLSKNSTATPSEELDRVVPGWYPDPFSEKKIIQFKGTRSIWLTWFIPANTAPGDYVGSLTVNLSNTSLHVPVSLHVWNFSLPEIPSVFVTNWLHIGQLEKFYEMDRGSEKFWNIIENIARDMRSHRQSVIFTPLGLIRSLDQGNRNYQFDFRDYDRWIDIFKRNGFSLFEGSHLVGSRYTYNIVRRFPENIKKEILGPDLTNESDIQYLKSLLHAIYMENQNLGIGDKYIQHIADEAKPETLGLYREMTRLVRSEMPGVPIIDATELSEDRVKDLMDIPVVSLGKGRKKQRGVNEKKLGNWWYTAAFPRGRFPNRFIDYPLIKIRSIPWLTWRYGYSGYLHYAYNWWYSPSGVSPWKDTDQAGSYPPGDGFIVYPPLEFKGESPISSLRWEEFRDGLEDYELLVMLEHWQKRLKYKRMRNENSIGQQIIDSHKVDDEIREIEKAFDSTEVYPSDPLVLLRMRNRIGDLIDRLNSYEK